jgi:hypothetical protein
MKAYELLDENGVEKCPECKCAVGQDWEYKDFSNKMIIVCPQCDNEIYVEELQEGSDE